MSFLFSLCKKLTSPPVPTGHLPAHPQKTLIFLQGNTLYQVPINEAGHAQGDPNELTPKLTPTSLHLGCTIVTIEALEKLITYIQNELP